MTVTRVDLESLEEQAKAKQLPEGRLCSDCAHIKRCVALGFSWPNRTECDFYPSRFRESARTTTEGT